MNAVTKLDKVLLWACIEDYAGLWELLWEVNTKFPALPESERKRVLVEAMQLLLENDLIKLYYCKEPYGDLSELDATAARLALEEDKNWEAPELNSISIRAGATQKGEALYEVGNYESFR